MEPNEANLEESRCLKVRYSNGNERTFAFSPLEGTVDNATLFNRVSKSLDSRRLLLQMEDRLLLIPFDNVESIEILPAPSISIPDALHVVHEFS